MSIDLDVKLTKEIKANDLIEGTRKELRKLINLSNIPHLEIKQMINGIRYGVDNNMLLQPSESYFINFKGIQDEVGIVITVLELQLPYITDEEAGQWFGIIVQGEYPIKFLLSGAMAIYISSLCGTKILDENCFWSRKRENDTDNFRSTISFNFTDISFYSSDLQTSSKKFYDLLPKGK